MSVLPLIVFDVNETLLDLETMEPTFERIFGEKSAMRLWFANFIMYSAAPTFGLLLQQSQFSALGSAPVRSLTAASRPARKTGAVRRNRRSAPDASPRCRIPPPETSCGDERPAARP